MDSWWQKLEQELDQQFDRFLSDHPNQKALLDQEHWNEQQRRKQQRLIDIDQEAQQLRQQLLKLSQDINAWSERVKRARKASAHDLAGRAETHLSNLMGQGRAQWQELEELGRETQRLKQTYIKAKDINDAATESISASELMEAWESFERDQEIANMRRKNEER